MAIDVVWFKRDLRTRDHAPLLSAILSGRPVLCLFMLEPERFKQMDTDPIHIDWELDCAIDLSNTLRKSGSSLHFQVGDAIEIFENLNNEYGIERILSHEETGNSWSYERDKKVSRWCETLEIKWIEYSNNGVVRKLKDRDFWKRERDARMRIPLNETPTFSESILYEGDIPTMDELNLNPRTLVSRPIPGEVAALKRLQIFLDEDSRKYSWAISSPVLSTKHGSVLSPYFTAGVLSLRRVVQETNLKIKYLRKNKLIIDDHSEWIQSLSSFRKRLAWRCHFIQKLEMEPNLDLVAQNPIIEKNLERKLDSEKFLRWKEGKTGWPFFDACMRQLTSTGWINFRMRAMMMSAASYNLWLPWRETGIFLAKQFLDYEPGIHWSQVGMQSGTTGINTIRAYSMTKQGRDHDPKGDYIRKWVPELSMVPTDFIHEPWKMPESLQEVIICRIGVEYPEPIVNELVSRKNGVSKSYSARTGDEARRISKKVLQVHGSRSRNRRNTKKKSSSVQQKLF
jgi:deoxyribodipyrimidine photo-lyase